ncbi:CPBP family intramembrane glutamic endopeptidase [Jannaschia formosa]|uniref:CPBP family intramembrane glutamic endopeptidase n=1 Tax=Jannaschia formosa TaxID=2259592 RepID=UPI001075774C|nr:type II CAAX endopeptidase family protein [Jannaschia formosa]TFL18079.1 CPBP family intramembrane metalloprotease [Jannaschia formosa]
MWTPAFARFVAPARARASLWRLVFGVVTIAVVYVLGILAILGAVWGLVGNAGLTGWMQRIALADTPTAVLLMLGTFVGMFGGTVVAARLVHKRAPATLTGDRLWPGFALGTGVAAAIFGLSFLFPLPFEPVRNVPLDIFLTFLPLALLGLLLQTGAEEVLFRGYLQQQLAARFDHPAVWIVLPSLVFGALHYNPALAGPNALWLVAAATLFGLVAADLTRVTGSIGVAWGVHFANNAAAILILALNGSLSGLSLWKTPFTAADTEILRPLIVADMLTTLIVWAVLRVWLGRRQRLAT